MKNINRFYPHLLALLGFVIVAVIYFSPVLQGKKIFQSDIVKYTGMAKEQNDFRAETGKEPYWTNSAFGGMPTYQMGANYPHNYIKKLDSVLRFLPRPADYLFLYFIGFYILLCVLRVGPLKAFIGALAFGLSTYMIIILGAGHNAKAHAIAYMPMVVAGVILVFRRKYIAGGLLTMVAAALEINANHFQMTYYLLFLLLTIGIYYLVKIVKAKEYKSLGLIAAVFAGAALLAVAVNAAGLMATAEFTDYSIRGKSELTINPDGSANETDSAMDYGYITEYSYGIAESFNLLAPRLFGGGSGENVGEDSVMDGFVSGIGANPSEAREFVRNVPTYWGDQPIVEAPAYIGAVVFFLALMALFIDKRKIKYAFLAGALLSLFLSWGKNFPALTTFFIDFVPLYDKFRAVSSIQVILELCFPVLAIMGLQSYLKQDKETQWKGLKLAGGVAIGIIVLLFLFKGSFSFTGMMDMQLSQMYGDIGPAFVEALQEQREGMYTSDLFRSGLLILAAAVILWAFKEKKVAAIWATGLIGLLMVGDLWLIDRNYVNNQNFVSAAKMDRPFEPTDADRFILEDTGYYRVYEPQGRLQGRTSYFHNSVGGYSAVRPRRMDELFSYLVDPEVNKLFGTINTETMELGEQMPALNLLNIKYLIVEGQGQSIPITNPFANGAAWFVSNIKTVNTADDELMSLKKLDSKNTAVVNSNDFAGAVKQTTFVKDDTAAITVTEHEPNYLKYTTNNTNPGFAVFSEMYYADGWKAFVDGKEMPHYRADYVLRAMNIPAGRHTVEFKFEPQVVQAGGMVSLIGTALMVLVLAGGVYFIIRRKGKPEPQLNTPV